MDNLKWLKEIDPIVDRVVASPWDNPEFYRAYVSQLYHFVRYSTRMLAAAASVTESSVYYRRLIEHIKEESGHEKLALADLQNVGGKIENYPELGMTRAMWEPQFYKIQKRPSSLLGYILALEIVAVRAYPDLLPKLEGIYGQKAVTFIRVHGMEDPDHVEKAIAQIVSLPETEKLPVIENFEQTCSVIKHLLYELGERAAQRSAGVRKPSRAA